jgi:predicted phosphoadenosine phosphosulfate sulfurtransferase
LEAQYKLTIDHARVMFDLYADLIDVYWVCLPMLLRNAVSQFEPRWCCWEPEREADWVRPLPEHPGVISDPKAFPFFEPRMEFEEFMVLFGEWYGQGQDAAAFVGIRCDESLNRFRTIASRTKETHGGQRFTTKVSEGLYNIYPLYDWHVSDLWKYHARYPQKPHNAVYDRMHLAGLSPHQMRLCQPYGDDQRRGLWLYHIIEPETWARVVARVNGANSGALYVSESGNVSGNNTISLPPGHTWKSFCNLMLGSLPKATREHNVSRFRGFLPGGAGRGYVDGIPDFAPRVLEKKQWAPSWRRLCKVLLRNDWWCKGLGLTQPKSAAYGRYLELKRQQRGTV